MPQNFSLNRDVVRVAVEAFKTRKTMKVVVEMLGDESTPTETMPPPPSIRANMELAVISTG